MKTLKKLLTKAQIKAYCALTNFMDSERGDTNFISILIIVGIVVVLAGLFLTLGKDVASSISDKVTTFLEGL